MARTKQTRAGSPLVRGKSRGKYRATTSPAMAAAIKQRYEEAKRKAKERQAKIDASWRARGGYAASGSAAKSGKDPVPSPKRGKDPVPSPKRGKDPAKDQSLGRPPKGIGKSPRKKYIRARERLEEVDLTGFVSKKKKKAASPKKAPPSKKRKKNDPNPDGLTLNADGKPTNCGSDKTGVKACKIKYVRKPQCRWRPGREPAVI